MSGKRMIHESLFSSSELNDLPIKARYLYISMIVHADDAGRMRADPRYLKLKSFPFDNHSVDKVRTWRNQLSTKAKLIVVYQVDGKEYLFHPGWDKWQILRKDRMKPTDCPNPDNQLTTSCQPNGNQRLTNGGLTEVNRSEVNRTEPKGREGEGKGKQTLGVPPNPPSLALSRSKAGHVKNCTCQKCFEAVHARA